MFRQPLPAHKHLRAFKFTSFKYLKYIKAEAATDENVDYKRHLLYNTLEDIFQILCVNVCFIYAVWYICLKWFRYSFRSLPTNLCGHTSLSDLCFTCRNPVQACSISTTSKAKWKSQERHGIKMNGASQIKGWNKVQKLVFLLKRHGRRCAWSHIGKRTLLSLFGESPWLPWK